MSRVETMDDQREGVASFQALLQLVKPGITRMVMVTMLCGALAAPGAVTRPLVLLLAVLATALVVAGANAINMVIERDTDALMARTRSRPLPTGQVSADVALGFGLSLSGVGLLLLFVCVNALSALLAGLAFVSYVLVYTPLKRVTPWALHIGAIPGALPPVIGWVAVRGMIEAGAGLLFLILFVWQLPHFIAIAVYRRSEYSNAGLRVIPVVKGLRRARRELVGYTALLILVSFLPSLTGTVGGLHAWLTAVAGAGFAAFVLRPIGWAGPEVWARRVFLASMPYLVVVFGAAVVTAS